MKPATHVFKSTVRSSSTEKMFFTFLLLFAIFSSFSQQKISGKVTDINNVPLPGVSILEKNTTNGVVSDFDGNFQITLKNQDSKLVFSYLGFLTQVVPFLNKNGINIIL